MSNKENIINFITYKRASDSILHDGYLQLSKPYDMNTFISFINNFYNEYGKDTPLKIPIEICIKNNYNKSKKRYRYISVNFVRDSVAICQGIIEMLKITQNTLKISPSFVGITENLDKNQSIYEAERIKLDKKFQIKRDNNENKNIKDLYEYIINIIDSIEKCNFINRHISSKKIIGICSIIYKFYF